MKSWFEHLRRPMESLSSEGTSKVVKQRVSIFHCIYNTSEHYLLENPVRGILIPSIPMPDFDIRGALNPICRETAFDGQE